MDIEVISQDKEKEKLSFILKDSNSFFANTLRRIMIEEVPTLAIEDVEFRDNSSALYDEIVAHRLGLIPIKTDLKGYTLPADCSCKGEGCAKCQLKMTLKASNVGYVHAESIKSKDPKCKPVHSKMPIVKMTKGQGIELEATAVLGKGKDHIKWGPCLAYYKAYPIIKINKDCEAAAINCPVKVFDFKNSKLSINKDNLLKCHLCNACVDACPEGDLKVDDSKTDFVFYIESWGQLEPKEIVKTAIDILKSKTNEFGELLKKLK